jgi:antitoxin component of RelBE/YafQ-DinJ toxin-antitoxin module
MDSKLTVRLDSNVIDRAKSYARNHNISVSRMIESYLDSVTQQKSKDIEITPLVRSLSGVVKLSSNDDFKKDYADYLSDKYK